MNRVKVFTNSTFNQTIEIEKYLQPVTYHVVLGINFFADFMSSFSDFFGGRSQSYQSRLESINNEVIKGIKDKTYKLGGNAAIDLKIDNDEISAQGKSMIMVTAIATAVVIKENKVLKAEAENRYEKNEDALGAISYVDFEDYALKAKFLKSLHEADRLALATVLSKIEDRHFTDLLPDIFQAIVKLDIEPPLNIDEVKNKFQNSLSSLAYEERSEFLFSQYYEMLQFHEHQNFHKKLRFITNRVEETKSVNYKLICEAFRKDDRLHNRMEELIAYSIDKKSLFFKSDIEHLKDLLDVTSNIDIQKSSVSRNIEKMISLLEGMFNENI